LGYDRLLSCLIKASGATFLSQKTTAKNLTKKPMMKKTKQLWLVAVLLAMAQVPVFAQSGVNGLNTATTTLKTYVDPVTNIALVIGGIVGIVGAIRVYSKWNSGDHDINKELMGWGGSCVFLVVSALIIKAFFGL
jgi:hypothetical protein